MESIVCTKSHVADPVILPNTVPPPYTLPLYFPLYILPLYPTHIVYSYTLILLPYTLHLYSSLILCLSTFPSYLSLIPNPDTPFLYSTLISLYSFGLC